MVIVRERFCRGRFLSEGNCPGDLYPKILWRPLLQTGYYAPATIGWGHNALTAVVCLSVRLSRALP